MGFLDKTKQLAEQAQQKLDEAQKNFNQSGQQLVGQLQEFRHHDVQVLGSFIFGLPSDRPQTFDACVSVAEQSGVSFAQFVMLQPLPGRSISPPGRSRSELQRRRSMAFR